MSQSAEVLARRGDRVIGLVFPKRFSSTLGAKSRHLEDQTDISSSSFFVCVFVFDFFFLAGKHFSRRSEAVSHDMMKQVCRRPCLITVCVCVCVVACNWFQEDGGGGACLGGDGILAAAQNTCESWHAAPQSGEHNRIPPPHPPSHRSPTTTYPPTIPSPTVGTVK